MLSPVRAGVCACACVRFTDGFQGPRAALANSRHLINTYLVNEQMNEQGLAASKEILPDPGQEMARSGFGWRESDQSCSLMGWLARLAPAA